MTAIPVHKCILIEKTHPKGDHGYLLFWRFLGEIWFLCGDLDALLTFT